MLTESRQYRLAINPREIVFETIAKLNSPFGGR